MSDKFGILFQFLERFGNEAEGRERPELPAEAATKLHQLARGKMSERERTDLFVRLNKNPHWVALLAQEVKALREEPRVKK